MTDWEVVVEFSVSGRPNYGGDGFAFWFVESPQMIGSVYGAGDFWNGLGIFFDTYNNDGMGKSPLISAVVNDGSLRYDYASDGASQALASCSYPFRNLPSPSFAKITYQNQALSVDIALNHGDRSNPPRYEPCFRIERTELGVDKYFGLTAHTGDVADNHDVHSVTTHDLSPPNAANTAKKQDHWAHTATGTGFQELSTQEFQHQVLTLLHQLQSAANLLEVTQISMSDLINAMGSDNAQRSSQVIAALQNFQGYQPSQQQQQQQYQHQPPPVYNHQQGTSSGISALDLSQSTDRVLGAVNNVQGELVAQLENLNQVVRTLSTNVIPQHQASLQKAIKEEIGPDARAAREGVGALRSEATRIRSDLDLLRTSVEQTNVACVNNGSGGGVLALLGQALMMAAVVALCLVVQNAINNRKEQRGGGYHKFV